jgi:molybdenum cofactor cytidylyltransferase
VPDRSADPVRRLAGIVLAAGGATRFGAPKQLARLGDEALVVRAARLALASCPGGVVVVTGAFATEVRAELSAMSVRLAHNDAWPTGLASSIRCGIDALPAGTLACLLMLCDQAALDEDGLRRLVAGWAVAPDRVAAASYAGTLGVPAIFSRELWPGLRALTRDQGARSLIASLTHVTAVSIPGAAYDVDSPGDLDVQRGE